MDLPEFIRLTTIINRLAKRALFAEKQMVALDGQCTEWKRIADELKAERDAERASCKELEQAHDQIKTLLDRVVSERGTLLETRTQERDAFQAECDDLRRVFSLVHGSLGIKQGEHIGNAIEELKKERDELRAEVESLNTRLRQSRFEYDALKKERDELRAQIASERERHGQTASILAQYAPKTMQVDPLPRSHLVKVGEWVERTGLPFRGSPIGQKAQVTEVRHRTCTYKLSCGRIWDCEFCTPCDPPEATHDTPEGKETAAGVAGDRIKCNDKVRLINTPPEWESEWGEIGDVGTVKSVSECDTGVRIRETGFEWPRDCIEKVTDNACKPQPGDVVRLVRVPTHTDIPALLPWSQSFGMPGDTATVMIMAVPDKLPSGTIPVRTNMGRCFLWPLSCVEIVGRGK